MEQRRIGLADIAVGQPLLWDVKDAAGHLLLRRGQIIHNDHQIEVLIGRGLFIEHAESGHGGRGQPPAAVVPEIRSVLRLINTAEKQLERLLFNLSNEPDATAKFLAIGADLQVAIHANRDIAIATVLLNQGSGAYPVRHCIDTAIISLLAAERVHAAADEVAALAAAALSMNLGMLREQSHLQSKVEPLTDSERAMVRGHPEKSVALLREAGVTDTKWLDYVLHHHENEDGSGYPNAKSSADIPKNAKILSLADRYCARISARDYRPPMLPNAALRDFLTGEKMHVDQELAAVFVHLLGIYPCGTFVRLADGETAIVSGKGDSTTTPVVHAILGPRGAPLSFPIKRDTSKPLHAVREVLAAAAVGTPVSMQKIWGNEASM